MDFRHKHIRGIVDELMNNSMKAKATAIDVHIEYLNDAIIINVKDNGKGMTPEKVEELKKKLNQPRRRELEEYYGALTGQGMVGSGLSMVGIMTDWAEIHSEPGEGTEITVQLKV